MTRLGDVLVDVKPGFATGDNLDEGVFQFRMHNFTRESALDLTKRRRVTATTRQLERQSVAPGDILFNATNSPELVGKSAFIGELDEPAVFSNHFMRLRTDPAQLDSGYLAHFLRLQFSRGVFRAMAKAWVNQATIGRDRLEGLDIPLPPLPEQRRIAAILDHADALRAKRRQVLTHLDEVEQSIFLSMFGHDRERRSVSELCSLVVDCVNRTAPIVEEVTPYKMLRTTNVRNGVVDTTNVRHVTADVFDRWNRRATPRHGDVLLTREAPVGEAGVLLGDDQVFLGQRLMLYRVDPEHLTADYLAACFRSPILQEQFNRLGSGSTVKHLPLPACRNFDIPVAPIEDQRRFSQRVAAINDLRRAAKQQTSVEASLFATLQSRAFRGEF